MRLSLRRLSRIALSGLAGVIVLAMAAFGVGGYFDAQPFVLEQAIARGGHDLVAVYWAGDMGMRIGMGRDIIDRLRADGIPVLIAKSPVLFGRQRDAGFADRAVGRSLQLALAESGARRVAIVGSSFGSDMLVAGLGHVLSPLRDRIAAVVLVGPGRDIYFHANPTGIFYKGPTAVRPAATVPLLKGLAVTCIFGAADDDSLCPASVMAKGRRVIIHDGHMMLWSHALVADDVLSAVRHPPSPM